LSVGNCTIGESTWGGLWEDMEITKTAPVGVFDSGVGGLTVAREIMRQLPDENIVYFGDTARVPYGSKSKENIIRFSRQIIRFLKTKNVKAIVIACNTASALALDVVKNEFDIPIIGVIVPGARAAVRETRNKKIGVVGTEGTIHSEMYTKVIREMEPEASVLGRPCPLFVPLVEEGFAKHHITDEVIEIYLEEMKHSDIDTMILGCTHYPLLRSKIMAYFGEKVHIVNPAYETALDLKRVLESENAVNDSGNLNKYEFYVSDAAEKFKQFANSILPYNVETITQINIEEY
jgi:glutamate racemase